jgi:hypothetical protein
MDIRDAVGGVGAHRRRRSLQCRWDLAPACVLPTAPRYSVDRCLVRPKTVAHLWPKTSIGGLAQPCGAEATSERKAPANDTVQRSSSLGVVVSDSACHAGGVGSESRRSRDVVSSRTFVVACAELV